MNELYNVQMGGCLDLAEIRRGTACIISQLNKSESVTANIVNYFLTW